MESSDGVKIFVDPDWEKFRAPIVPPKRIVEELRRTGKPVWWETGTGKWLMLYRTEFVGSSVITRLRPGSIQPIEGWLQ